MTKRIWAAVAIVGLISVTALTAQETRPGTDPQPRQKYEPSSARVPSAVDLPAKKTVAAKKPVHTVFLPGDIEWVDAPPSLPAGAKMAVLEGDPGKSGYFAMRLRVPDGYRIMPHWHPNVERLTVISGALYIGMGDTFDETKGHEMPAGTYATMAPKVNHFAWTKGETEIQVTTLGPWKLVYVNPADDPSKTAKK